eukprot:jgi/Bigna1/126068/aug1.2_g776
MKVSRKIVSISVALALGIFLFLGLISSETSMRKGIVERQTTRRYWGRRIRLAPRRFPLCGYGRLKRKLRLGSSSSSPPSTFTEPSSGGDGDEVGLRIPKPRVAVIGGGVSGAVCAEKLFATGQVMMFIVADNDKNGQTDSNVLQKNAAAVVDWSSRPIHFDIGTQYISPKSDDFVKMVDRWSEEGWVQKWDGKVAAISSEQVEDNGGELAYNINNLSIKQGGAHRWIGVNGMSSIAEGLISKVKTHENLSRENSKLYTPITRIERVVTPRDNLNNNNKELWKLWVFDNIYKPSERGLLNLLLIMVNSRGRVAWRI